MVMVRRFLKWRVLGLGFCISLIVFAGSVAAQNKGAETYVPGELLVKFKDGPDTANARAANRKIGAVALENLGDLGWQRVRVPGAVSLDDAMLRYKTLPGVEYVQPNYYYHLLATPNDVEFTQATMYGMFKISAPAAWDINTGSDAVIVADIDTGHRYTHQDLAANTWVNPGETAGNGVDDDANGIPDDIHGADFRFNDGDPSDEHGHGTHTAGTIGAVGNNAFGVVGVNWNVKIMAIKIFSSTPTQTTTAMLINAYNYVRLMKSRGTNIRVTNNSYGGCTEACGYDQATKDAIDALGELGVLNVFAAGNSGTDNDVFPHYPSNYTSPSILAVAASDQNDARVFSYGLNSVDLAAPGINILSTTFATNVSTGGMSGTSMATPHVAGAAALLAAYKPDLSAASLKATLMNTVDLLPAWTGVVKTGGRLNVARALETQTECTFTGAEGLRNVPTKGGVFTINITAAPNCDYSAKSTLNWLKVLSPEPLSGNGTVTFRVTVNPTITRTGTIKIAGQTYTVRQSRI